MTKEIDVFEYVWKQQPGGKSLFQCTSFLHVVSLIGRQSTLQEIKDQCVVDASTTEASLIFRITRNTRPHRLSEA